MTIASISDQAVEIAAEADYYFESGGDGEDVLTWYEAPDWVREESRARARYILEAVAPYLVGGGA